MSVQTIIHSSIGSIESDVIKGLLENADNLLLKEKFRLGSGYCDSDYFHDSLLKDILRIKNCDITKKINNIIEAENIFDEEKND